MSSDRTMILHEERLSTPIGETVLLTDEAGALRVLDFEDYQARMVRLLRRHYGANGFQITVAHRRSEAAEAVLAYFAGCLEAIATVRTATNGTSFQRQVWHALRSVHQPCSYSDLARAVGRPQAVRAVGAANGANPIAIVIPCHRVIGRSGSLTGYGGGMARKAWLLAHEARQARRDGSLI